MRAGTSMRNTSLAAALACATALAGCGGASGSSPAPVPGASSVPGALQAVRVTMTIAGPPATKSSATVREPTFVSPSSNGVAINAYLHSDTQHTTVVATSATDVSSGSSACGGQTGFPRTCSLVVAVPAGNDDFVITTYDAAPNGGTFTGAHVLGADSMNQTIGLDVANVLNIFISGVIASLGPQTYASLPADGATHTFAFVLQPQDFDNNPIAAGTNDPYANPISVTLAEAGGSGHATFVLNGAVVGTRATITHSTDTIALRYDGLGPPGYATLSRLSATGVTSSAIRISPLYVTSTSPYFSGGALAFTGSGQTATIALTEGAAPPSLTYTVTPNNCTNVATASVSGSTLTVTAGTNASAAGCTFTVSDGMTARGVNVINTISGVPITIGGFTVTTFLPPDAGLAAYRSIAVGPDGNLWMGESSNAGTGNVTRITTSGTIAQFPVPGVNPIVEAIAAGPDGNLWITEFNGAKVDRVTPTGVVTQFPAGGLQPLGITAGPDGNVWFALAQTVAIGRITPGGVVSTFPLPGGFAHPEYITMGADGNLWFSVIGPGAIGRITPTGTITMFPIGTAGSVPNGIAAGPDGNVWFADAGTHAIGRITPTGTITEFALPSNGAPIAIATGADGNLWFTETLIPLGKITPSGTITEFNIPGIKNDAFIVGGPDGNLWLSGFQGAQRVQF